MSEDEARPGTLEPHHARTGRGASGAGRVFWMRALPAFAVALCLLLLLPMDGGGDAPPIRVLLLGGFIVATVMTITLWLAIRFDLGLGAQVATYAVAFNVLIVGAKLVLGPYAVYEVNQLAPLSELIPLSDPGGAIAAGGLVFALYALVLWLLFAAARRSLRGRLGIRGGRRPLARRLRRWWPVVLVGVVLVGMAGTGLLIVGIMVVTPGFQYIGYVLSSAVSLVVAATLAIAFLLAAQTFRAAQHRAVALGNAAVLTSLFWVCLAFLALYQVLWVVFLLALTSVWPLKVVTPK